MKSQIQKKKREWWNCGITNRVLTFFQKKPLMKGQKLFWAKKIMGMFF